MNDNERIKVLLVDDDAALRESLQMIIPGDCCGVTEAACLEEAYKAVMCDNFDIILLDLSLPDGEGFEFLKKHPDYNNRVIVLTGTGSVQDAVKAMKAGAFDFLEKPVDPDLLLATLDKAAEVNRNIRDYRTLVNEISGNPTFRKISCHSPVMSAVLEEAKKIAGTENNVLVTGETGTGKELMAHAIHNHSLRKEKAFISVNCASIPENLAESELFGHKKGAFTGAIGDYPGKFQLAAGGTIFLDEIGELPPAIQGKLLRTLESGEVSPLKSTRAIHVDVRVIAATNKDLQEEIKLGNFRSDLYFRLDELSIHIPPLRDRLEDIMPLSEHFLRIANIANGKRISTVEPQARRLLTAYPWPGNIRELKNVIKKISALITGKTIKAHHLPARIANRAGAVAAESPGMLLKNIEKRHILKVLKMTQNNHKQAAGVLGISRATLYRKLQEYDKE